MFCQVSQWRWNIHLLGQMCHVRVVLESPACSAPPPYHPCLHPGGSRGGEVLMNAGERETSQGDLELLDAPLREGKRTWGQTEQHSREGQTGILQRLGFIVWFSFSSMRYQKLWCTIHSHRTEHCCQGGAGSWGLGTAIYQGMSLSKGCLRFPHPKPPRPPRSLTCRAEDCRKAQPPATGVWH